MSNNVEQIIEAASKGQIFIITKDAMDDIRREERAKARSLNQAAIVSTTEAAQAIGISKRKLYHLLSDPECLLRESKVSNDNHRMFTRTSLEAEIKRLTQ